MDIERVRILKTLKSGGKLWKKGDIFTKPIPPELTAEVRAKTGTVEVLGAETAQSSVDEAVSVRKAQLEAESVNKIAKLEKEHAEEIEGLQIRIKVLEENLADMTERAETAEKKLSKTSSKKATK